MKKLLSYLPLFLLFAACSSNNERNVDDTSQLFYNGNIITMEGDSAATVEAVVEEDGKIAFVGNLADAEKAFPAASKIDLSGRTMLPGFIDPHSHIGQVINTMGQVDLSSPPVGNVKNFDDILTKLKAFKQEKNIADGEWIFGWGYDENQLDEKKHISKIELDRAFPNNPVYVQHTSGHMGVANTKGLEKAGLNANSKNPDGGMIVRLPGSQELSGLVQETAMYYFAGTAIEEFADKKAPLFDAAQDYYIENGVTTAQEGMSDPATMAFLREKARQKELKIDVVSLPGAGDLAKNIQDSSLHFGEYHNRLKFQGTKIIADGSPQGKTAYFTQPYLTPVDGCTSNCRGLPSIPQAELNQLFTLAYKNKHQLFIHSNGDASIDMIIKAHETACQTLGQPLDADRRIIVIHSQFVRPDQLATYKKYRLMPSFFTNHAYFWGDDHVRNLGEKRAFFLSPMRAAEELGLTYTNHSDCIVTPINPLFTVWSAVNRVSRSGVVIGPDQRVSPYLALKATTLAAATQYFEEDRKGSLKVGKIADFVVLDQNPLTLDPMKIKDIRVMETIKEGKSIYKRKQ